MKPKVVTLPVYAYINGENKQLKAAFIINDELYNRYKDYGGGSYSGTIHDVSGTYNNPVKYVNDFFNGVELLGNSNYPYYCVRYPNDVDLGISPNNIRYTEYRHLISKVGANVTEVYYNNGHYGPMSFNPITILNGGNFSTPNDCQYNTLQTANETLPDQSTVKALIGGDSDTIFTDQFNVSVSKGIRNPSVSYRFYIYPEDIIVGNALNPDYAVAGKKTIALGVSIWFQTPVDQEAPIGYAVRIVISLANDVDIATHTPVGQALKNLSLSGSLIDIEEPDPDNPYSDNESSTPGGGDGNYGDPDALDPARIPDIPNISAADLGFISIYNPSQSQLKQLAAFLWSNQFDISSWKKLFTDPMEAAIGLAIVPVAPTTGGSKNVVFGSVDSGISMPYLTTNYVKFDCGWLDIQKYVGSFLDYTDTKISIYLPYIGIRDLEPNDIMGGAIHVAYIIDVLTGACACFIEEETRGVLYTYNGSCITNVPITAANFSGAIQNAVSAVISGIGVAGAVAGGGGAVAAMGAVGLLNTAANTIMNNRPQIQRSGNLGGSAGIMTIQKPYVIIERPRLSVPYNMQKFVGQCSNISNKLVYLSGFTMCEYVHIENCIGTSEEIAEIENLLKQGVYL